jgi:hypothetical protein
MGQDDRWANGEALCAMILGKTKYKQSFIGRYFGKIALKEMMNN